MARYQSYYQKTIATMVPSTVDPRHVEAYMRLAHTTLDHLSRAEFRREVRIALKNIQEYGASEAEDCAKSYGL